MEMSHFSDRGSMTGFEIDEFVIPAIATYSSNVN